MYGLNLPYLPRARGLISWFLADSINLTVGEALAGEVWMVEGAHIVWVLEDFFCLFVLHFGFLSLVHVCYHGNKLTTPSSCCFGPSCLPIDLH